jgi:hypothetical protein
MSILKCLKTAQFLMNKSVLIQANLLTDVGMGVTF